MKSIDAGAARPLGASWSKRGVNFALLSSNATRVEVCLYDPATGAEVARHDLPGRTADAWHGLISPRHGIPGLHYAFYVHGPNDPQSGQGNLKSAINVGIWRAFKEHNITIPYPQREVRLLGANSLETGAAPAADKVAATAAGSDTGRPATAQSRSAGGS